MESKNVEMRVASTTWTTPPTDGCTLTSWELGQILLKMGKIKKSSLGHYHVENSALFFMFLENAAMD